MSLNIIIFALELFVSQPDDNVAPDNSSLLLQDAYNKRLQPVTDQPFLSQENAEESQIRRSRKRTYEDFVEGMRSSLPEEPTKRRKI